MPEGTDVFEIIHSTRAMRRLKPDPVPDELIRNILLAGQAAASGGNTQRWRFLVLKDPEIKKKVQVYYKKAFDEVVGPRYDASPAPPGQSAGSYQRTRSANEYLTNHYHEAPVWIVACLEDGPNPTRSAGSCDSSTKRGYWNWSDTIYMETSSRRRGGSSPTRDC